jgi:dynamin 1-like protein
LVLHLVAEKNSDVIEWGEFDHIPGQKIQDFGKIHDEIEKFTSKEAGNGKAISNKPIFLTIHSPSVVDLILIDLPGLTKVSVGDQPENIEHLITELVESYISSPSTIILAVTAANIDIANSDALKIAKKHDPDYSRTLGVITKIDLMDKGTNAVEVLQNKVIPLKLGFFFSFFFY